MNSARPTMTSSSSSTQETIIQCTGLSKAYPNGKEPPLQVLHTLDFNLKKGEQLAIVGASGSGKSTLLHLLAGLDKPTTGTVLHQGRNLAQLNETEKSGLRNRLLGFVYQFHHLLPDFSAVENVMMPLLVRRIPRDEAHERAAKTLASVGLSTRVDHRPSMLSGGERQRVALARALICQPLCLLADEPTGNLDEANARSMFDLMLDLNRQYQTALLMVTHDMQLAQKLDRRVQLSQGRLVE